MIGVLMEKNILKAAGLVTIVTIVGKLLGFGREAIIAAYFGASSLSDVYFVAAVIPTILFTALSLAISTGIVPIYVEERKRNSEEAEQLISALGTLLLIIAIVITIIGSLFAPVITKMVSPGFKGDQLDLAITLTRIMLPSFFFFVLSSIATGVLHANQKFLAPAMITVPSNLIIILFTIFTTSQLGVYGLAIGTLVGAMFQFIIQYPQFKQYNIKLNFSFKKYINQFKSSFILLLPIIIASVAVQFNEVINRVVASGLPEGSISALNYSNKLMYLPLSVIVMSIITVLYPSIVHAVKENKNEAATLVLNGIRMIVLISIPIVLVMLVSGSTLIELAFQRGAFSPLDTERTTYSFFFYTIGLIFVALREYFVRCFLALEETKVIMVSSTTAVLINIILSIFLAKFLQHGGVALGFTISMLYQTILLAFILKKKIEIEKGKLNFTIYELLKMSLLFFVSFFILRWFEPLLHELNNFVHLSLITLLTLIMFIVGSYLLKIRAFQYLFEIVIKKINRNRKG
jgi:putative peptidoglycan lipid II flippase